MQLCFKKRHTNNYSIIDQKPHECRHFEVLHCNYNWEIGQQIDLVVTFDWAVLSTQGQRVWTCKILSGIPHLTIFGAPNAIFCILGQIWWLLGDRFGTTLEFLLVTTCWLLILEPLLDHLMVARNVSGNISRYTKCIKSNENFSGTVHLKQKVAHAYFVLIFCVYFYDDQATNTAESPKKVTGWVFSLKGLGDLILCPSWQLLEKGIESLQYFRGCSCDWYIYFVIFCTTPSSFGYRCPFRIPSEFENCFLIFSKSCV